MMDAGTSLAVVIPSDIQTFDSDQRRRDQNDPPYRIVTMTPELAAQLLDRRRPGARRHAGAVRAHAMAMREHRWLLNGLPITTTPDGVLIDGVQRLLACVEVQMSFETFFSDQVQASAASSIEKVRPRSLVNSLEAHGMLHASALQAALAKLMRIDDGTITQSGNTMPSFVAMDRALRANPQLQKAINASLALRGCKLPEAVRSPLMCMGYQLDRTRTDQLLDAFTWPERHPPMHPGVVLRHEIERLRKIHTRAPPTTHILALAVKALEAALNGNMGLRRLRWIDPATDGGSGEIFPHLTGYGGLANGSMVTTDSTAMTSQGKNIKVIGGESSLSDPAEISFMIETIDPHRAATYVACGSRNRRISRVHVEAIARDLAENRWVFNAQPICFARGGRLLDGQHRLQAVILAKRSIEVPVVRGLDELVCLTYENSTKRRTDLGDQLGSFGDRALVYAMANLLWRHERRTPLMRQAKATQGEIRQIVLEHPRLLILRSFARRMGDFGRASVLGYAAYVMERENAVFAADFLAALETGANLRPGSPILSLRGTLQKLRGDKASPTTQLAALLAGWKRFKESALSKGQRGIV